jgi:hypothetical protein
LRRESYDPTTTTDHEGSLALNRIGRDAGERDAELNGELTAILQRYNVTNIEQILTEAHRLNHKTYRVSITIGQYHDKTPASLLGIRCRSTGRPIETTS